MKRVVITQTDEEDEDDGRRVECYICGHHAFSTYSAKCDNCGFERRYKMLSSNQSCKFKEFLKHNYHLLGGLYMHNGKVYPDPKLLHSTR